MIPFCSTIDSTDSRKCDTCGAGYTLNKDRTECLHCHSAIEGCASCTVDPVSDSIKTCDSCFTNSVWNGKECEIDGCTDTVWNFPNAECNRCDYGLARHTTAHTCTPATLSNCVREETNGVNTDCKVCEFGYRILSGQGDICERIDAKHCDTQAAEPNTCEECEDGYYLTKDGLCVSCSIPGCEVCSVSPTNMHPDCTHCLDDWSLVLLHQPWGIQHACVRHEDDKDESSTGQRRLTAKELVSDDWSTVEVHTTCE